MSIHAPAHLTEDEELRQQRWDAFVALTKAHRMAERCWSAVLGDVYAALLLAETGDTYFWRQSSFEKACLEFAEIEGWRETLQAIARAMLEQALDTAEVERHR